MLHNDALDAQVVSPDLLHELGVVLALDVDATLPGNPRPESGDRDGPGGSTSRPARRLGARAHKDHRGALEQEPGAEREDPALATPILKRHGLLVPGNDGAAEPGLHLLDDKVGLERLLDGAAARRGLPVGCQHILAISVVPSGHAPDPSGGFP